MAMATKDTEEVERIRRMGQITIAVVGQTAEFLASHAVQADVLVKKDGSPLTVSDVKQKINLWLAERGAENPKGTIFSIGRDAAVPHTSGNPRDILRLGQTIIFDIYPCEAGGGYYYDLTRTWCLGFAPDEALTLYEDVLAAYRAVERELRAGTPLRNYQELVCKLFRERGHPTLQENPVTDQGYVHGLGHGVGLYLHQEPFFQLNTPHSQVLPEGAVVTVEPGLYYPERGLGVRLEDTFWIEPGVPSRPLADYPLDLVLPLKY
jgi:Xaa-Pro aminopeptidase